MRPTFAQLEAFYWIARLGSAKEAARHLHVAQPTISLRVDDLEAALGGAVFERAGRGLTLTRRGEALLPRVAAVIEEYGKIRGAIDGGRQHGGLLRIGVTETFAQACLPACLRAVTTRYPLLQLEIVVGTSADLEARVLERQLDVAFVINPAGDPKLTLVPLGVQPVTWAASPAFGLHAPLHPSDLRGVLVITNPSPAPMWRQIVDWFRQAGLEPSALCRCNSVVTAAQLVTDGLGVSLLPRRLVHEAIAAGTVRGLDSALAVQPSRMFAIYRFADGGDLLQDITVLAGATMEKAKLIVPVPT